MRRRRVVRVGFVTRLGRFRRNGFVLALVAAIAVPVGAMALGAGEQLRGGFKQLTAQCVFTENEDQETPRTANPCFDTPPPDADGDGFPDPIDRFPGVYSRCGFAQATIIGTESADTLIGTPARDVIMGFGGDDVITGLDGDDVICAGDGNDLVFAGGGDDLVYGQRGDDLIRGGPSFDVLDGGGDTDTVNGGRGIDACVGELLADCDTP